MEDEDLTPDQERDSAADLLALEILITERLEILQEQGDTISPEEAAKLADFANMIMAAIKERAEAPEMKPYTQATPTFREASRIVSIAENTEKSVIKSNAEKKAEIIRELLKFARTIVNHSQQREGKLEIGEDSKGRLDELITKLIGLTDPSSREIIKIIKDSGFMRLDAQIDPRDIQDYFKIVSRDIIDILKGILGKKEDVTEGFLGMRRSFYSFFTIDPSSVWEEDIFKGEDSENIFVEYSKKSNKLAKELFSLEVEEFEFCKEVEEAHTIEKLRELGTIEPATAEDFRIVRDAYIKIELMHNLYYVQSEIDREQQVVASKRLDLRMGNIVDETSYGRTILNPPNPKDDGTPGSLEGDPYYIEIDRYEVDEESKTLASIVRKMILKNLQKPGVISDFVRARIFLPEFKSRKRSAGGGIEWFTENIKEESKVALAIILSHFGNDLDLERIRSSIISGGTNVNSTGNHRGIHITFTYKYQDKSKGFTKIGEARGGAIEVELQILGYMTQKEEKEDHERYAEHQTKKVRAKMCADMAFEDYVMQLADTVNSCHDFGEHHTPISTEASGNKPINRGNYREKALLLQILSKRNEEGKLVNLEAIQKLLDDHDTRTSLLRALDKMAAIETEKKREIRGLRSAKGEEKPFFREMSICPESGIKEKARRIRNMLKSGHLSYDTEFQMRKRQDGTLEWRKVKKQKEKGTIIEAAKWDAYYGKLQLISSPGRRANTKIYKVERTHLKVRKMKKGPDKMSQTRKAIPKYVMETEEGNESCYMYEKAGDVKTMRLLWEVKKDEKDPEKEIICRYDKDGQKIEGTFYFDRQKMKLHPEMFMPLSKKEAALIPQIDKILAKERKADEAKTPKPPKKKKPPKKPAPKRPKKGQKGRR